MLPGNQPGGQFDALAGDIFMTEMRQDGDLTGTV